MSERYGENIIFMLTKDEVMACANELGISEGQVTDDVIELVKRRVSLGLGNWPEVVKSALREAINVRWDWFAILPVFGGKMVNAHSQEGISSNQR